MSGANDGAYTLQTDYTLAEIAQHVRAGRLDRAAYEAERLARLVRQPGLRALLVDAAASWSSPAVAKPNGVA